LNVALRSTVIDWSEMSKATPRTKAARDEQFEAFLQEARILCLI